MYAYHFFIHGRISRTMLKRIFAVLLCIMMIVPAFSGCSSYDPNEDVGKTINLYFADEVYDFDPAFAYSSKEALQLSSLMYIPLFSVDDDGKLVNELVDDYEITDSDDKGIYRITLNLKNTSWSDGNRVSANDILFAWKRILNPNTISDAAVLLYEIKNAYDAKNGNCSVDDIAVYAINDETLQIDFDTSIDFKAFLYNLASPCLVPLRETIVNANPDWSKSVSTTVCSGPFTLRAVEYGKSLTLERNSFYFRNRKKDSIKEYVTPYRLVVDFTKSPEEQLEAFNNGELSYIGNIALPSRADYESKADKEDALSTTVLYFNLDTELFANLYVRQALSLAIDREALAEMLVFAEEATGLVPTGVFNTKSNGKDFREVGGDLIASKADVDAAKKLLADSKVNGGSFNLTIRDTEVNAAIADKLVEAWKTLGFDVSVVKLSNVANDDAIEDGTVPTTYLDDEYRETALIARSFDVLLADISALSTDAFSILAPYAAGYSCRNMTFNVESYEDAVNITGYETEGYNNLIDAAFAEKDLKKRAEILHDAEKLLMDDLPVVPLVFNETASLVAKNLKNTSTDYFGYTNFSKANLK